MAMIRNHWMDIFLGGCLGLIGFLVSVALVSHLPQVVYDEVDMYYGADINRVYDYMTGQDRFAHFRSSVHPIFSFLAFPPTRALMGAGLTTASAAGLIVALTAFVTCATIYAFGRLAGLARLDAVLLTTVFTTSATFIHWWSVPETFAFGGMSVAMAFTAALLPAVTRIGWIALAGLTLAFTTTNWVAGFLAASRRLSRGDTALVMAASFAVVAVLAVWQKAFIPTALFFFSPAVLFEELTFVGAINPDAYTVSPTDRIVSFLANTWVAPDFVLTETEGVRPVHLAYGPIGWLALLAVGAVFVCSFWNSLSSSRNQPLIIVPSLFLVFQFLLHMVYGDEPFLYSAHFLPAMICLAALGFLGKSVNYCRAAALIYCVCAAFVNVGAFLAASRTLSALPTGG
jgi:hypothetical protein